MSYSLTNKEIGEWMAYGCKYAVGDGRDDTFYCIAQKTDGYEKAKTLKCGPETIHKCVSSCQYRERESRFV